MGELMKNMPGDESFFKLSNEGLISSISTQRITNSSLFSSWLANKTLGLDHDFRKDTYEKTKVITLDEMKKFFDTHISGKNQAYLILGNVKMLDMKALSKIGEVKLLKLEDVFGY
jgi:hypothetical protein